MKVFRSDIRKNKFKSIAKWMNPQTNKDKELLLKHLQLDPREKEKLSLELNYEMSSTAIANCNNVYTFIPRLCASLTVE